MPFGMISRKQSASSALFLGAALTLFSIAHAAPIPTETPQDNPGVTIIEGSDAVTWQPAPPMFPHGTKIAILTGDTTKPGPFTLRVMMPAGSFIPPHTHNLDEMLTVISGNIQHFVGQNIATTQRRALGPGGFVHLPVNVPHAIKAGSQGAVLQVSGTGPFSMAYVNPQDDPRNTGR
ncbi:cupin domain-containing protein [Gluconobacter albidus]|uniref:cupin domain-containing protein n=1 Tax=Gluconobacter albidus TaxID=318683 RepID=UPI001B8B9969|nr:cupin domain-containing protein [Gluconobacter albidus]MBS1028139.1 cupin domain-containing protein [Gluconobacter albidus]